MAASYWDSTQRRFWEFTKEQLADIRQRKQDEERSLVQVYPLPEWRHLFIFFNSNLLRLSKRMQIRQQAIATAQVYLKRFYCKVEIRRTNPYLTMTTALYLACKTEECPQHIRQVVQEAKNTWPDMHCLEIPRLGECEFFMISELSSHLIVHAPYRTLNTLQLELSLTAEEFLQAWSVINDHYMTDLPLLYPPHVIAVAAVIWVLVLQTPAAGASSGSTAGGGNGNTNNGSTANNNNNNDNNNNSNSNNANSNISTAIGMGGAGSGSMTPNSLNSYNLNGIGGGFSNINSMTGSNNMGGMGGMNMNMGMNMGMGGMNMSMGMNMGSMSSLGNLGGGMAMGQGLGQQNMSQNSGAPGVGGTQSSLPPPPSLHMSLSSLSGQGSNSNNTPGGGGNGTPGGAGGPGTPGLGGAAGTPSTAGGIGGLAMAIAQANARAVVSAAMQPGANNGATAANNNSNSAQAEETVPADGSRGATLQWLFRWLTDSGLDLEATIDCTQEMISFYMANEEYSEKQTREQVHRFIKARGLDR